MLTTGRDRRTSSTGLKERRAWHAPALGIVTVCLLTIPGLGGSQPSGEGLIAETSSMRSSRLPILFVPNRGQTDSRVQYYAKGPGFGFYFTPEEAVLRFVELSPDREALEIVPSLSLAELAPREGPVAKGVALALRFLGANPEVELEGRREATEKVSYFIGNDPEKWRAGLPTYHEMVYRGVWPQVDGHFRVESGQLKYEFVVHPGGNVNAIRLAYRGADGLSLDEAGNLRIETRLGVLSDQAPRSYQEIDGERVVLATRYLLERSAGGESTIRFAVDGKPDPLRPIVIDPGLAYSTFLGGISRDAALAGISVDAQGFAYVAGYADSVDFPTTVGAFDTMPNGDRDIFVAKILPDGSDLVYSTFIGGNLEDQPWGMTLDASGNVYLTGHTASSDFPTTAGAFDTTYNGVGFLNVFVTKLDGAGNALAYSTFLGGSTLDQGQGVAVDSAGFAYVTGWTCSPTFPTTPGAFSTVHDAVIDAFAAKLDPSGATLVYSTFIGGDAIDVGLGIDVDSGGNAYVAGWTSSSDYPTTGGALDTMSGGESDGIVTKLDPSGSSLIYSTLLGGDGPGIDIVFDIKVDASGTAYLAGHTTATDFPTTLGTFDTTHNGGNDAFVSRLDATGSGLIYSTFVGGGSDEESRSIALDASGAAVVAGSTNSADFPATPGAYNTTLNGDFDGSLVRLDATGATLLYSTYLGGTLFDHALGVALDPLGEAYVAGATDSADYPTTGGAFDPVQNGDRDALVTKLVPVDDFDGDGIADLIDLDPLNFSDEFSDVALGGMTTGRILSRGNQILTLTDSTDPAPDDGVRIAASLSGGPAVSIVQACSPPSTFFLDEGDVIIVTCTSVSLNVKRGTVEIDLVAEDGRTATAVVGEGNRLVFDSTDFTFFAPPTNPEAVVLIIGGKEILLAPGQTAQGITIDIMPGSDSNPIRCGNPRGVIPVAVLSTDVFDARAVDHTTVTFGPLGAAETHATPHGVKRHEKDVDGDGDIDLVLHFRVGATGLGCDATQATLSGETFGGAPVAGADGVRMIE